MAKKIIQLDVSEKKSLTARRRARQVIGSVKPQRVEEPAPKRKPKHKKRQDEGDFGGQ